MVAATRAMVMSTCCRVTPTVPVVKVAAAAQHEGSDGEEQDSNGCDGGSSHGLLLEKGCDLP